MHYYTTDPATKAEFTAALRELADYLDTNPQIPVPRYGTRIMMCAAHTDEGGCAQVGYIAKLMDSAITDDTPAGGHYWAAREFGPVRYEIVAVSAR